MARRINAAAIPVFAVDIAVKQLVVLMSAPFMVVGVNW
jgi:hypothetical protein